MYAAIVSIDVHSLAYLSEHSNTLARNLQIAETVEASSVVSGIAFYRAVLSVLHGTPTFRKALDVQIYTVI